MDRVEILLPAAALVGVTALVWVRLYVERLGEMRARHIDPQSLASLPIRAVADEETGVYRLCVPAGRYDIHAVQAGLDNISTFARLLPSAHGRRHVP